jgi:3-(3-hydroxy-phenyl)propionate hydroxylase/6-hydroxy-3-succinoylpyridine 3-monooxygenase
MHQRSAETYRVGRVLLCGDAAHVTNPTSGFGLIGGMYDAFALSEALAAHVCGKAGQEILDRYAHARRITYLTVTSPISAESLRMAFYNDQPARLENDLITLRALCEDRAAMRKAAMIPAALETPSLVDGRTFVQKLSDLGRHTTPVPTRYIDKFIRPNGPIRVGPGAEFLVSRQPPKGRVDCGVQGP